MTVKLLRYILILYAPMAVLCSCQEELPITPPEKITSTVHYSATVTSGDGSRATVDDDKHYIFEAGDRLYVVSGDDMYGYLTLTSGVGTATAEFEGELTCVGGFEPSDDTSLSATLVSINDAIHTCTDGNVTISYPQVFADDFADAVSKYSNFTASSTYSTKSFTLAQQSCFLIFSISFDSTVEAGKDFDVTLSDGDNSILRTSTVQTEDVGGTVQLNFAAAFESGATFTESTQKPTLSATSTTAGINDSFSITPMTLLSNRYYTFSRNLDTADYFTIEAIQDDTQITFQYAQSSDGVQYSTNGGKDWNSYLTTDGAITLAAGKQVLFRGQRSQYYNSGSTPLFTVADDKPCYVLGNMMSLVCTDNSYTPPTSFSSESAFRAIFKDATWIKVDTDKKLTLPATTLTKFCYQEMFSGCTGLEKCPVDNLPAEVMLENSCFQMFYGCSNMVTAPTISATTMAKCCFEQMFSGCANLSAAPELSSTSLASCCYKQMFKGCSAITDPPALPATTLQEQCYSGLFYGCVNLSSAPTLDAAVMARSCYYQMFYGCTSLATAPSLPSESLANYCYGQMFFGCTGLTSAPASLPASTLVEACYYDMFNGCSSLTTGPALGNITDVAKSSCRSMFQNCTSLTSVTGTITASTEAETCLRQMFSNCTAITEVPSFTIAKVGTGSCYQMFNSCSKLETLNCSITATVMAKECFFEMFHSCTKLFSTSVPSLDSATTLAQGCFKRMFRACRSLVTPPALPADTMASQCYMMMFDGCTGMTSAPALNASTLDSSCYQAMFWGCTKITSAPDLPATTLAEGCYYEMFESCTGLTAAPDLPAETLVTNCYFEMFRGCTALCYVKCLATDISATGCVSNWLNNVKSNGDFYRPASMASTWTQGVSGIPSGWTAHVI